MVFHLLPAFGFYPTVGFFLPGGAQNIIPEPLRAYIPYYPKTNTPFLHYIEWNTLILFPLGMKAFPDKYLTSINKQMYRAIVNKDFDKIEKFLDNDLIDINKSVVFKEKELTSLGLAASLNLVEVVHYLTLRGVDYEYPIGSHKKTALHIAIENGNELTAKFLLNNGANINAEDIFGFNVYDKAELRGYFHFKTIFEYFKNNKKTRKNLNFNEYRYSREFILENMDSISFKPSSLLEMNFLNILNPELEDPANDKIDLSKFNIYFFNQYDMKQFEKSDEYTFNRKNYDNLYNFNIKLI